MPFFALALGVQTEISPLSRAVGSEVFWASLILSALMVLLIAVSVLFVLRWFLRTYRHERGSTFAMATLLITLPKFRREEEAQRVQTKETLHEAIAAAESFFSAVGGMRAQHGLRAWLLGRTDELAFEIVMHKGQIKFYVSVPATMKGLIEQQLSAAYPDANVETVEDYNIFSPDGVLLGSYLVLRRPHMFPIKTFRAMDKDPLNSLTNVLSKIPADEGAALQFVVRSAPAKWRSKGVAVARRMQQGMTLGEALRGGRKKKKDASGREQDPHRLSPQEEQMLKGLEEKASKAGMDVCLRLMVSGKNLASVQTTMGNMLNAFAQYNIYEYGNSFVKVMPRGARSLIRRFIHRTFDEGNRMVLNNEEMASLWHLPLPSTETPNILWLGARSGAAPTTIPGPQEGQVEIGFNKYRGVKMPVWIKQADRQRHMYLIGKSGSGKSQLIAKMAVQDIVRGAGVAVVDPHGDLVDHVLAHVPPERAKDVIYFCPADTERPMGLNMLEADDESTKDFAVQEMIAIFYKLFPPEMIGPMFEHNMRNVMLTLMSDAQNPGTIAEIPRMFSDEDFQKSWVAKVRDPVVRAFWEKEMAKTSDFHKSEMLGYLISKVGRFVENEMMRNIIGQKFSSFNFRDVMDEQKILLVNLSKGRTGDVNADLLGMIIVSKLQMAALSRADLPEAQRKDFYLYIDEFQNFITDSIATILSEARKYRLNLIVAHQYIGQLVKNNDTKIRDAVFGNVGTMLTSRVGPEDVEMLEKIYSPEFSGYDLINSDKFTWYVKMIVDNSQQKPFTLGFDPLGAGDAGLAEDIKELSRLTYGRPRASVEADIMERTQLGSS